MEMMNEVTAMIEAMDPAVLGGVFLGITAVIAAAAVCALIRYVLKAIGYGNMYRKAGEAPWKAFIPVFNTYTNYRISWNSKMFFLYAALLILFKFTYGSATLALQLAAAAAGVAMLVVDVKQKIKMANLFGKGAGTAIALIFFPGITTLILGLGKAEFQAEMAEND